MPPGIFRLILVTLQLNFRSRQALVYGFVVPVFFLVAFGSVFQTDTPPLIHEMGQLLTITLLGGACFGLPTALVAERERGVWRRYRLLPVGIGSLLSGVVVVRLVLLAVAAAMQIGLARVLYHTPLPMHPAQLGVAFLFVAGAFLGLGLLVAALADDVPAVQALGQCLFLPMIMIGGVGVPLAVLPVWAQRIAGFMPGRYAVDALQRCLADPHGLRQAGFDLAALTVIGLAAGGAGLALFRWDAGRRPLGRGGIWLGVALLAWVAVGATAASTGRLKPVHPAAAWEVVTDEQIAAITYNDLPTDNGIITPLAPPFGRNPEGAQRVRAFATRLAAWAPAHLDDSEQSVRNLLSAAAIGDLAQEQLEGDMARAVFDQLQASYEGEPLRQMLAWIALNPNSGTVIMNAPELGFARHPPDWAIRNRNALYARKFLGRLVGEIKD
jgi:ABC-type multidrug transport system permease subunit